MCLNSPTLPFLPCFITFCSTHSYTSHFYEIFATCSKKKLSVQLKKNSRESKTTSISAVVQVHQIWTYPKNSLMFISEIFEVKFLLRNYIYYSMGYEPICIYCSLEEDLVISEKYYPICASCLLFIYRKFNFSCIICV